MIMQNKEISVKLKAAFLLIAFSMNTIIGFACAVGLDHLFKSSHHHRDETLVDQGSHHHHDEAEQNHKSKDNKDNCCNDHVSKFAMVDKSLSHPFKNIIVFTTLISTFYNIDVLQTFKASISIKYFVRSYHPPIRDIRIAIQSFQI